MAGERDVLDFDLLTEWGEEAKEGGYKNVSIPPDTLLRLIALALPATRRRLAITLSPEPLPREALDVELRACLDELAESPLPGARYAYEVVKRRFGVTHDLD